MFTQSKRCALILLQPWQEAGFAATTMSNAPSQTQTLVQEGATLKLRSRKIGVEVLVGPNEGLVRELDGPEVRIGSKKGGTDLVLGDPTVSRHHLTLTVDDIGLRVVDTGSRNATFLDGIRIRDAYARPGAVIDLGNTRLRIHLSEQVSEIPISSRTQFGALLGSSIPMRRLFGLLERVAPLDTTVLIEGETGTGKELVAEALHEESPRAELPFIVFDCSAVARNLVESELFGHVRGAFTGADRDRAGAFEQADGGTLFLDEIGELPLDLQPKLLRLLETREVQRVGENTTRKVDVRIVAATNRSLSAEVQAGRFREDLFYRLAVILIPLPPLRERVEDIPVLVDHFVRELTARGNSREVLPKLSERMQARSWPGNVRELRNAVEMAMAVGTDDGVEEGVEEGVESAPFANFSLSLKDSLLNYERNFVAAALTKTQGNVSRAAALCRTSRQYVQRAIKRFKLRST